MTLLLEAINTRDMPGFYLNTSRQAFELMDAARAANVRFQYDVYHMQIMEGDVIRTIRDNFPFIGHYHTGGVPGRREIDDSQELNYRRICLAIADLGFTGYLAQEFIPSRDPLTSLREASVLCSV